MSQERSLWDYLDARPPAENERQRGDKDKTRRQALRRARASGHWLTLLRAGRTLPQPFTLNDVSVAAWRACPEFFGMKGYPYPDNHKVHYILYGERGLIAKGLIRRVQQGLFTIPSEVDPEALALEGVEDEVE
jgi:hypothetical protein